MVDYGKTGRVLLTTLTKEFFVPRFAERDEGEREQPTAKYPWDGVSGVRPFHEFAAHDDGGGILTEDSAMAASVEEVLEKAFAQAFLKALDQTVQTKAEELVRKALTQDSPLSHKLQHKMEQGFQHLLDEGIRWEKRKPGFKK